MDTINNPQPENTIPPENTIQPKVNKKNRVLLSVLLAIVGFAVGFCAVYFIINTPVKDKTFSTSGMSITLTNKFNEQEYVSYTSIYSSKSVAVYTLKETYADGISQTCTLGQYAELVMDNNLITSELNQGEDCVYFDFDRTSGSTDMFFRAYCYKVNDGFWLIQFACKTSNKDTELPNIEKWASSVTFSNAD